MIPLFTAVIYILAQFLIKTIIEHSSVVKIFKAGDLIHDNKGFILQNVVLKNVSVNIPPFLETR